MSVSVSCWRDDCKWCEHGWCNRGAITISEEGECEDFECYLDDAEWQIPFWKRMKDPKRNQVVRAQFKGKKIEMDGRVFFVESNSAYATLTDEESGMNCGKLEHAREKVGFGILVSEKVKDVVPPLEELPIAVYNEDTREFIYTEEGKAQK